MPDTIDSETQSSARQQRVTQPTRGAERNQSTLTSDERPAAENMLLPSLEPGLTLLDIEGGRSVPLLQSLVLDHLLMSDGPAFWVDAQGQATTTSLARLAPSQRLLDRIHVARGFTAYQHYGALCDLPTAVNRSIQESTAQPDESRRERRQARPDRQPGTSLYTPSLIVAPALDAHYRAADSPTDAQARTLQTRALARLSMYADVYEIPVLLTRTADDKFTAPIERTADQHLRCEQTRMGPRFVGEEFETLVYPVDGGAYYQTTIAYWQQLLGTRAEQVGIQPTSTPSPSVATDSVGTGITTDGTTTAATPNPLLDAWTGSVGAGGQ